MISLLLSISWTFLNPQEQFLDVVEKRNRRIAPVDSMLELRPPQYTVEPTPGSRTSAFRDKERIRTHTWNLTNFPFIQTADTKRPRYHYDKVPFPLVPTFSQRPRLVVHRYLLALNHTTNNVSTRLLALAFKRSGIGQSPWWTHARHKKYLHLALIEIHFMRSTCSTSTVTSEIITGSPHRDNLKYPYIAVACHTQRRFL
jgi:hypothetical protein